MKKNSFLISNNIYGLIVVSIIALVVVAILIADFTYH